jgi:hypothetical protein
MGVTAYLLYQGIEGLGSLAWVWGRCARRFARSELRGRCLQSPRHQQLIAPLQPQQDAKHENKEKSSHRHKARGFSLNCCYCLLLSARILLCSRLLLS